MKRSSINLFAMFAILLFGPSDLLAKPCELVPSTPELRTLSKGDIGDVTLPMILGARVQIRSRWSKDSQIVASGVVQEAGISNDRMKIISLRLRQDDGKTVTYQHSKDGADTLEIRIIRKSHLPGFKARAKAQGLTVRTSQLYDDPYSLAETLRKAVPGEKMRVAFVSMKAFGETKKMVREEAEVTLAHLPSDSQLALSTIGGRAVEFEFMTEQGPLKLKMVDILAVAYRSAAQ